MRTALLGLMALSVGVYAQSSPPGGGGPFGGARFLSAEPGMPGHVVKNAPYSADVVTESTQTLADGNRIHQTSTARVYRDSEGRTRREQSLTGIGAITGSATLPQVVFIDDPVAGVNYALNPNNKTAMKSVRGRPGRGGRLQGAVIGAAPNKKTESLGRQTMEGLAVDGTRTTMTIPAEQMGNELPIQMTGRSWYSADLHMSVLTRHSDPRSGETVTKLINVSRTEPPHAIFEVPAEFKISEGGRGMPRTTQ